MGFTRFVKSLVTVEWLEFTETEQLPEDTQVYQLDNGTIFYYCKYPSKLYVKWKGNVVNARLSNGEELSALRIDVHENAIFFFNKSKLYIAQFNQSADITVTFIRSQQKGERVHYPVHGRPICSIVRGGELFVFRIFESADEDGINVDVTPQTLEGLELIGVHRGKIIYTSKGTWPSVSKISENVILLKLSRPCLSTFYRENIPFFYVTDSEIMTIFNTDTCEMLPPLFIPRNLCIYITTTRNETLVVEGDKIGEEGRSRKFIMTTKLPNGYFEELLAIPKDDSQSLSRFYICDEQNTDSKFEDQPQTLRTEEEGIQRTLSKLENWLHLKEPESERYEDVEFPREDASIDYATLDFMDKEILPEDTNLYKTDDGTVFYHKHSETSRLYVKYEGIEIEANLPGGSSTLLEISMQCHGNAIYFFYRKRFYKVVFDISNIALLVTFQRDQLPGEMIEESTVGKVVCRRERDGMTILYRMCDDPYRDGVAVPSHYFNWNLQLAGIHWGKVIFCCRDRFSHMPEENVVVLENIPPFGTLVFSSDASPFFYIVTYDRILIVLNVATNNILPFLQFPTFTHRKRPYRIAWVHDGEITVEKHGEGYLYMGLTDILTAQLPKGYFDEAEPVELTEEQLNEMFLLSERSNSMTIVEPFKSELSFQTKFEMIKILGQGGYGCVFEARNRLDTWRYAVKRIPLRGKPNEKEEAWKECRALASFDFPGIVRYNNSWTEDPPEGWQRNSDEKLWKLQNYTGNMNYRDNCSFLYIQMELCQYTLSEWLKVNSQRETKRMKFWFKQIVSAVEYIHGRKLIHRDLKASEQFSLTIRVPNNILFAGQDRLKVCDLGIVADRAIRNGKEVPGTRTMDRGTAMYMAPEQRGWNYSSKVDIFALGLILVELSIVIRIEEAQEVFELYQRGKRPDILRHLPQMEWLVNWMTSLHEIDRPDCTEILNHRYLE